MTEQEDTTTEQGELRQNHVCSGGRVSMCHHSRHGHRRNICVRPSHIQRHLQHGDTLGKCPEPEECPPEVECGEGTTLVDGECVPENPLTCGPGTVAVNGQCVPVNPLTCGPGTVAVDGQCVPVNPLTCGPGTVAVNGQCVPENPITCGPGTVLQGNQCVATAPTCTPDQVLQCVCAEGDADFDGVCNDSDVCPGMDDHIDTDGDGRPDGCDDDVDVFEPNDTTPYPISFVPLQVTPLFADGDDIEQFSFHALAGQVIVTKICANVGNQLSAPLFALRNDNTVVYTNVGGADVDGCVPAVEVSAPTTGTYVFITRERANWNVTRLSYSLFIDVR